VTEALLFPKLIGWKSFDPVLEIVTTAIHGWLAKRDYPVSQADGKVDRVWTEKVARSIVEALVKGELVAEADTPRAIELAQEEISINLMLSDPPPQQG
jgi:hypothetical protein